MHKSKFALVDLFACKVVGDVDMFGAIVKLRVVCNIDRGHIVGKDGGGNIFVDELA